MKKLLSFALAVLMIATAVSVVLPAVIAEEAELLYTVQVTKDNMQPYLETCTVEKAKLDGKSAVKITPNRKNPNGEEIVVNCSFNVPIDEVHQANWMTVEYQYDTPDHTSAAMSKMAVLIMPHSGAIKAWVNETSENKIRENEKDIIGIRVNLQDRTPTLGEGKKLTQMHFYPFGRGATPLNASKRECMYITEVKFWKGQPTLNMTDGERKPKPVNENEPEYEVDMDKPIYTITLEENKPAVYGENTAFMEEVEIDGKKYMEIRPNTDETQTTTSTSVVLDYGGLGIPADILKDVKYIVFNYKYEAPDDIRGAGSKMNILIMPYSGAIKQWVNKSSDTMIKEDVWSKMVFSQNFASIIEEGTTAKLAQWHLSPFGKDVNPKTMSPDEVLYLGDIELWAGNPLASVQEYSINFSCRIGAATGDNPKTLYNLKDTEYTLPENPYTLEGGTFLGWKSSDDGKLYQPGDKFVTGVKNVSYSAEFDYTPDGAPPFKSLNFYDYQNTILIPDTAIEAGQGTFEGKDVYKVVPNSNYVRAEGSDADIRIDGFMYHNAKIDLSKYKYMAVTYYIDGELPELEEPIHMAAGFSKVRDVLIDYAMPVSNEPIKAGSWQIASFDLTSLDSKLNPNMTEHIFQQIHFRPFHTIDPSLLKDVKAAYINQIMFFEGGSEVNLEMLESYMEGYEGGLFKPNATMTRAEAVTTVARLAAGGDEMVPAETASRFTDVPAGKWYTKYVTYVDSLGYLGSYSGNFLPNQNITRAEFVELVYNMGLLKDKGANGTFTDVAADHPRAAVIAAAGKAGLVNGYANGDGTFSFKPDATITRAEVVKVINNAYGRSVTKDKLSSDVKYLHFDVPDTSWAYPEIASAVLPHVESNGEWICSMLSTKELLGGDARLDLNAGAAKVAEIDALTAKRIEEIRNTPNMDFSKITGTIYYVSSSMGDDNNDGLSPEKPWKTAEKVSRMQSKLKAGDAVLFKRGDMWRKGINTTGSMIAMTTDGVTYSAYGEGAKPLFYGSPESGTDPSKWILVEGTVNMWRYATPMVDVGEIIFDGDTDHAKHSHRAAVDYNHQDGKFYVRKTNFGEEYNIKRHFLNDLDFFHDNPTGDFATRKGDIYLRCDDGNPAEVFDTIEFIIDGPIFGTANKSKDITVDNVCCKYAEGAVSGSNVENLTVTNIEAGWLGGTIHYYSGPNVDGMIRLGNGIGNYGSADGFLTDNCYVYQVYDAGISPQFGIEDENAKLSNCTFTNNVVEKCIYSIEHFFSDSKSGMYERSCENFVIDGNILRMAGYGFGQTRPNGNGGTHIKGDAGMNRYKPGTFKITNNIFDRSSNNIINSAAADPQYLPDYEGNTYIQVLGKNLGFYNGPRLVFDSGADFTIKLDVGDTSAQVYWLDESYRHTYRGTTY